MQRRDFLRTAALTGAGLMLEPFTSGPLMARHRMPDCSRWRGFNLLNYFTAGRPEPFDEREFQWIAEWGFNFVRLPLSYWNWSKPGSYYEMDERVLEDIDRAVTWGRRYGIHVCINLHRAPGYCVNPPAEPQNIFTDEEALEGCTYQWSVFARRYRKVSSRWLSFNLLNEVAHVGADDYERIVRRLVQAIRATSPHRLILIDGLDWGGHPLLAVNDLPDIVQCGRGYQPMLVSHYGASWVYGNKPMPLQPSELCWPLDAEGQHYNRQWLLDMQERSWAPLEQAGGRVFIGEFGCHNQTPHAVALAWLRDNLSIFRQKGWGWALWNLRGSFGVLDSGRNDVDYEDFHGHRLDRKMLDVLKLNS